MVHIPDSRIDSLLDDIEQLGAACSHSLKDPLRLALSQCHKMRDAMQQNATGDVLSEIEAHIHQSITRIERMRYYAFLIQNTEQVKDIDSRELVVAAAKACHEKIRQTGAIIQHGPLPRIRGRMGQLTLLLTHLLENSLIYNDAMPPKIQIYINDMGESWVIRVRDNGQGMEPEYGHIIFGLFCRIGQEGDPQGLGAGLAFCHKVAENHGGTISVDSMPGEYTEMRVTLPK